MNRDTLKTLAGLLIIGVIVVATFMYGNAQRKAQLKHDQEVRAQQEAKANASKSPLPSTTASAQPTTGGTAAVQSPSTNAVQGSTATATPTPKATPTPTATPAPQVAGAATTPAPAAGSNNGLPDTGPETTGIVGAFGILGAWYMLRRSKKSLYTAVRTPR